MKLHIIAVGDKLPNWAQTAFGEYQKRLPGELRPNLIAIKPAQRHNITSVVAKTKEAHKIIEQLHKIKATNIIALEVKAKRWSTASLTAELKIWMQQGQTVAMLIGGADGLSEQCLKLSNATRSMSDMTFPHALARVVLIEQLYRAYSVIQQHPYHRA